MEKINLQELFSKIGKENPTGFVCNCNVSIKGQNKDICDTFAMALKNTPESYTRGLNDFKIDIAGRNVSISYTRKTKSNWDATVKMSFRIAGNLSLHHKVKPVKERIRIFCREYMLTFYKD